QLNASASVAGAFVYTPPPGTVLPAAGGQTLSVTFTPADAATYTTATKTVPLNVARATPAITWNNPANVTLPATLSPKQLNATASVPGTFVYSPDLGTVLTAGARTLSVTFTPSDPSYATVTKTVTITAVKPTPSITWPVPANITSGTPLGSA